METVQQRFERLLKQWQDETSLSSRIVVEHPAHLEILAMGSSVLPCIFASYLKSQSHLCTTLAMITGENPIPVEHRGRMDLIRQDWLRWGVQHGYLNEEDLL